MRVLNEEEIQEVSGGDLLDGFTLVDFFRWVTFWSGGYDDTQNTDSMYGGGTRG